VIWGEAGSTAAQPAAALPHASFRMQHWRTNNAALFVVQHLRLGAEWLSSNNMYEILRRVDGRSYGISCL